MELMMHFDGEDPVEVSDADQETLSALEELREGVRTYVELEGDAMEPKFDRMWSRIERRIEANGHADEPVEAPAKQRAARVEEQAGVFERIKRWFGDNRGYVFTSMATAAGVALLMLAIRPTEVKPGEPKIVRVPGPTKIVKVPVEKIVRVPVSSDRVHVAGPAAVDSLDVTEGTTGAVLRIPGEEGENATTVIWLSPEDI